MTWTSVTWQNSFPVSNARVMSTRPQRHSVDYRLKHVILAQRFPSVYTERTNACHLMFGPRNYKACGNTKFQKSILCINMCKQCKRISPQNQNPFCASFWILFRETPLNSNSSNITLVSSHGSVDSLNFAQRWAKSSKSLRFNMAQGHVQQCCTQGNKKRKRRACRAARSNWGSWKEWHINAYNWKVLIFGGWKKGMKHLQLINGA